MADTVVASDDFVGPVSWVNGRTWDNGKGGSGTYTWTEAGFLAQIDGLGNLDVRNNALVRSLDFDLEPNHKIHIPAATFISGQSIRLLPRINGGNKQARVRLQTGQLVKLDIDGTVKTPAGSPLLAAGVYEIWAWCEDEVGGDEGVTVFVEIIGGLGVDGVFSSYFSPSENPDVSLVRFDFGPQNPGISGHSATEFVLPDFTILDSPPVVAGDAHTPGDFHSSFNTFNNMGF